MRIQGDLFRQTLRESLISWRLSTKLMLDVRGLPRR